MSNTFGKSIKITLFGESHGPAVGAVIDGLPPGLKVDREYILREMDRRRAFGALTTARQEADIPEFISGVKNGFTEGTPVALIIKNENARPEEYSKTASVARPSHADWTAQAKYLGFQDASGGGHFSGRLTAPLVAAGAILKQALEKRGILINTVISRLHGIDDPCEEQIAEEIKAAKTEGDSIGGVLKTTVTGLEAGIGEPWFDTLEGELAHAVFAIPAVKGIEFGAGFAVADMKGSEANDSFTIQNASIETDLRGKDKALSEPDNSAKIITVTNHSGGIQGGISNGMPIVFRTAVKPTPSIAKKQQTADFNKMENTEIEIAGRHDPAIIYRISPVIDAMTALVLSDMISRRFGYLALRSET